MYDPQHRYDAPRRRYPPDDARGPDPHRTERITDRPADPYVDTTIIRQAVTSREVIARERERTAQMLRGMNDHPPRLYLYRVTYQVMTYLPLRPGTRYARRDLQPFAVASSMSLEAAKHAAYWYTYYSHRTTWLQREKRVLGFVVGHDEERCVGYVYSPHDGGPRQIPLSRISEARQTRPTQRL